MGHFLKLWLRNSPGKGWHKSRRAGFSHWYPTSVSGQWWNNFFTIKFTISVMVDAFFGRTF